MELKKTPEADLESERTTFFLLGFIVALATLFVLLEWSSEDILPFAWEQLPPIVIESEYTYEMPVESQVEAEIKPETPEENPAAVVYEDYNVVEEILEEVEEAPEADSEEIPAEELQKEEEPVLELPPDDEPMLLFTDPETMPQYPGGYTAMNRYLFHSLKYPDLAADQHIEGRVWCSFIVNKDGSLSHIQVEKSAYPSLDEEAIRVLQTMPRWTPGTVRNKPVRVKVYLPIVFKL